MSFTYDDEADALYVYVYGRPGDRGQVLMASHGVHFGEVVERAATPD